MTHVLATINLKGGVGKTTLTVALAETFASEMGKRVLVIDLDPQTNATVMLIGEARWQALNAEGHTLARLFELALQGSTRGFDFAATLQRGVSNVRTARTIDLLPSSLDLIDVQDRLWTIPGLPFSTTGPVEQLRKVAGPHLDAYDIVLIDCPPNLGTITLNGLRIARRFIIPTIPDILSTYGIPQIVNRLGRFSEEIGVDIAPMGIVINKFQARSTVHQTILGQLRDDPRLPPVFDTIIPQANQTAAAAEFGPMMSYKAKWGYGALADTVLSLASEILARLESAP
jgi:chromosome partitioning protein